MARWFRADGDKYTIAAPNIATATYSVAAWIFFENSSLDIAICGYGNHGASGGGFQIAHKASGEFQTRFPINGSAASWVTGPMFLDRRWRHFAYVKYGSGNPEAAFFVDGVILAWGQHWGTDPALSTDDFIIGGPIVSDVAGWSNWRGGMEHFAYWNVPISPSEVRALAGGCLPGEVRAGALKIWAPFTEASGTACRDISSSAFTLSTSGASSAIPGPLDVRGPVLDLTQYGAILPDTTTYILPPSRTSISRRVVIAGY